jgi:hypothetical protein
MKAVRIFTRKFGHGTLLMFCQAHSERLQQMRADRR